MPGPNTLSPAEVDTYSIRLCVQSGLAANGWTGSKSAPVKLATNGWPKPEEITLPSIHVHVADSNRAGVELGSGGRERKANLYIFARTDPMKIRLAEDIVDLFDHDQVRILAFVSGSEVSPEAVGRYEVDEVGWRAVPMPASATEVDRYRATVTAMLRRVV